MIHCPHHETPRFCEHCGDRLIHQTNRGINESSSAFGQFVHDKIPMRMYWADIDASMFATRNRILRIFEHKRVYQRLRPSQRTILPILAEGLQLLINQGLIHPDSGVFVIESDPPFDLGVITRIPTNEMEVLGGDDLAGFLSGDIGKFTHNDNQGPF